MRVISIAAALSGVIALVMLVAAAHPLKDLLDAVALHRIELAAFVQLGAAAAGIAVSNRTGRVNMLAAALILGGAGLFSGVLYAISLYNASGVAVLAPVGGAALIAGWVVLAFAKPT